MASAAVCAVSFTPALSQPALGRCSRRPPDSDIPAGMSGAGAADGGIVEAGTALPGFKGSGNGSAGPGAPVRRIRHERPPWSIPELNSAACGLFQPLRNFVRSWRYAQGPPFSAEPSGTNSPPRSFVNRSDAGASWAADRQSPVLESDRLGRARRRRPRGGGQARRRALHRQRRNGGRGRALDRGRG